MLEKPLRGKGIWIRRITACEDGDLDAIVARARAAAFTHVLLKIADGADPYNLDSTGADLAAELAARLADAGIEVWGWQQIYGETPLFKGALRADYHLAEAASALRRMEQLTTAGARGYVVVAGGDYERIPDRARKADQFSAAVRNGLGGLPIGLAAWKYPHRHPRFPWQEFRAHCDLDLPPMFWIGRHGEAAKQLETSVQRFAALDPRLPCVPTGPAFLEHNWRPAPDDLITFFDKAIALGLPAVNLWAWDDLGLTGDESYNPQHLDFREHWVAVAGFEWREPAAVPFWLRAPEPALAPEPAPTTRPSAAAPAPPQPEEDFEPTRPYHPEAEEEVEPELAPALSFALEPEEDELPEWLREPEGGETAVVAPEMEAGAAVAFAVQPGAAPDEDFEPVRPYHPDIEVEAPHDLEPQLSFALEPEAEDVPDWLREPEPVAISSELAPTLEPAEELEPAPVSVGLSETRPGTPPLEPEAVLPAAEAVAAIEPIPPTPPDAEPAPASEPQMSFVSGPADEDFPEWLREPAAQLAAASETSPEPGGPPESDDLPDWLREPAAKLAAATEGQPVSVSPPPAAALESSEEEFEPLRPYHADIEEEAELAPALSFALEPEDDDLPEWLRETKAAAGSTPEPEAAIAAQPAAGPAPASRPQPAPMPGPALTIAPAAPTTAEGDTVGRFFEALRSGKPDEAAALYGPGFSHVNPDRVTRDPEAVRAFYAGVLRDVEGAGLVWLFLRRTRLAANVQWITLARDGKPFQGMDSFHLNRDGQIVYHHTSFRLGLE